MKTISYLLLDAFVVFLAIALFWVVLKKCASFFTCSFKLVKQFKLKPKADEKKSLRQSRSCATPIVEKQSEPREMQAETKLLTPFPELRDWSQYDSPAYLRKGVLIH